MNNSTIMNNSTTNAAAQPTTLTAAATGIIASGRCGTTAIALALGPSADPGISNVKDQVATWVSLWGHQSGLHDRARSAWPIVHRRIMSRGNPSWARVTGPMGATIASLASVGWKAEYPQLWEDPRGDRWVIDPTAGATGIVDLIVADATASVWKSASTAWCGGGLETGMGTD